ncbi:hypothetical protein NDU88_005104 [Pleurodeles waltl]|uniref:Uncharacterized protein n=1 Tax=Pleurodeles waltl TaxID=8319 RepID=A0AAV7WAY1_PLEWA|nr:hypothetical protein NDU88_005104 [Pleurodeles waltl]
MKDTRASAARDSLRVPGEGTHRSILPQYDVVRKDLRLRTLEERRWKREGQKEEEKRQEDYRQRERIGSLEEDG